MCGDGVLVACGVRGRRRDQERTVFQRSHSYKYCSSCDTRRNFREEETRRKPRLWFRGGWPFRPPVTGWRYRHPPSHLPPRFTAAPCHTTVQKRSWKLAVCILIESVRSRCFCVFFSGSCLSTFIVGQPRAEFRNLLTTNNSEETLLPS